MSELDQVLSEAAAAADTLSSQLSYPGNVIAAIAGLALKAGEAFAREGKAPVKEIARILCSDPDVRKVHLDWERMLDERFGRRDDTVPPAEDTTPDAISPPIDPYEH